MMRDLDPIDSKIIRTITHLAIPNQSDMARRAHVFLGSWCSYRCGFCYYKNMRKESFLSPDHVIAYMKFIKKYGIRELEFTGGEPTEYPHDEMKQILGEAKALGFERIAFITNGSGELNYYHELSDNVHEFLFSLHSYDEIYERITGIRGSYDKIKNAIREIWKTGRLIRLNIVICKENYNHLVDFAKHLIQDFDGIQFGAINFLPANTWGDAGSSQTVSFADYKDELPKAINRLRENGFSGNFAIRYIPYCELDETIRPLAKSHYQHVFDHYDWNQELDGSTIIPDMLSEKYGTRTVEAILKKRETMYSKFRKCLTCNIFNICDGYQNEYVQHLLVKTTNNSDI